MTRVSENSNVNAVKFAVNRTKRKLEDLQLKGTSLKSITKPSDNPTGNVEAMALETTMKDNTQYIKNADYASLHLSATEKSLEQLTDILLKTKEIAIAQSSDLYNEDIRKNISNEVIQLRNQALSIANKRVGSRYLFAGYKTLERPFNESGEYAGDNGHINVEVAKDFFVPINLNGREIFYSLDDGKDNQTHPLQNIKNPSENESEMPSVNINRELASVDDDFKPKNNIFAQLTSLISALENNDPEAIRSLLERLDETSSRLITLRTKIGSIANSVNETRNGIESDNVDQAQRKSKLVDADISELFSDLNKEQHILQATYKTSQNLLNKNLLDFLR